MLSYKASGHNKQYQNTLTRLRCEGNFKHNIKVLKEGGTDIVVVKRPTKKRKVSEFLPCPHCCGFYCKAELWRHAKKCDLRDSNLETSEISVTRQSMLLLESARLPSELEASESMRELMTAMRQDGPTQKAVTDELLCQFGEALLQKYGPAKKNDVAQRMRQLARLLITIQDMKRFKEIETTNLSFLDLISGKTFDLCVEGTSILCGLVITPDRRREYERPSLALRLGHLLKKLAIIKRGLCLRKDETDQVKEAKTFEKLLHDEWTDKVSTNALNTLKRRRDQTIEQLPETEDLLQLKLHQEEVRKKALVDLEATPNYNTWRMLAQNVLARLIIFNKRRAGEVAKLTMATYKNRPNWKRAGHSAITATLEPLEKKLLEKTDLVMVPGKRSRKVPILLPQDVLQAMELLMNTREQVGIPSGNAYFFSSRSSNGFLDGWQAINASSSEADLKKPELVTSTKCRKYNATITQLLDLGPTQVELLANHMGHSVNIHKEHYRLQESTIEITKVGKLLLAVDKGVNLKQNSSSSKTNESGQILANSTKTTEDCVDLSPEKSSLKITRKISTSSSEDPDTQTANVCPHFSVNITESRENITDLPAAKRKVGNTNKFSQEHPWTRKDSTEGKRSAKLRHRWTKDQEHAVKDCFKVHLAQKVYPSALQIKTRKANCPPLASKSVSQIKSKLQYLMKQ